MENIYMGYAQEDITPTERVQLVGYDSRHDNMSRGVLHRLIAQTLVFNSPDKSCCLVAVDSLGFTVELSDQLRHFVANALSTDPEHVMVCFSHTHSGPNADAEKEYYSFVCTRILSAVKRADSLAVPVKAAWGIAKNTVGVNRRSGGTDFDERLGVLKITGENPHDLKVLLLQVTAHANVLTGENYLVSSDYFGPARELLEKRCGCKVILIQGASGDVKPKYRRPNADYLEKHPQEAELLADSQESSQTYLEQSLLALPKMADSIYESVEQILDSLIPKPIRTLSMFSIRHTFYADVPTPEKAAQIAVEAWEMAGINGKGWINEVKRLQDLNVKSQTAEMEIQYLILDNGGLCGTPYEVMSHISSEVLRKSGAPYLFFNGYTNGCNSYLPTAEEYDKGGYEVLWSNLLYYHYHGRVMPFNRDTAERLEDVAAAGWNGFIKKSADNK